MVLTDNIELIQGDCLEIMKGIPDKSIDLVLTDPPYGLDDKLVQRGGKHKNSKFAVLYENSERWDKKPDKIYFDELFKISNNQIICGGNHFVLPPSRGIICWDKMQALPTFSRWEYIWTSFDKPAKLIKISSIDLNRQHPTQKPIELMLWIINNYSKKTDTIIDCFMGVGSTGVACAKLNRKFIGIELDPGYFDIAVKRIKAESDQGKLKL